MKEIAFRDAIRDAMSEEMRLDKSIFLMGEEVAEYNGAYKASHPLLSLVLLVLQLEQQVMV
jgi:pyruvate dehydrogenase E1 component beta subunit